jgi:hypothetical protein
MIAFLQLMIGFVLPLVRVNPNPNPYELQPRCYIQGFANVTRKDVLDDIFGFTAGALAADCVIKSTRYLQELERNRSVENAFNVLDTF